jgi:uncharacterized membrane protein
MADEDWRASLQERVERLERQVEELGAEVAAGRGSRRAERPSAFPPPESQPSPSAHGRPETQRPPRSTWWTVGAERWLGRVGVLFVVLALAFLFRYSIEQGWITPIVRLLVGMVLGVALLVAGLRLEGPRARYAALLLGGAVATFYLVVYASFQMYHLVPFGVAFSAMATVTVLAFVLADGQAYGSLAALGVAGGLATPFLIQTGSASVPWLVVYTCLVVAGTGAVQIRRGWRGPLVLLAVLGFIVMSVAVGRAGGSGERWLTLGGILVVWVHVAGLPLARVLLGQRDAARWPTPPLGRLAQVFGVGRDDLDRTLVRALVAGSALAACFLAAALFGLSERTSGGLLIVAAAVYALAAWAERGVRPVRDPLVEAALVVLSVGTWVAIRDAHAFLPLAAIAACAHIVHREWSVPGAALVGHVLFGILASWFIGSVGPGIATGRDDPFGRVALGQLGAVSLMFVASWLVTKREAIVAYRLGSYVGVLAWLAASLQGYPHGAGLVTIAWGACGIGLVLPTFAADRKGQQAVGLATLGLVAAKLLLVDMAELDLVWRILLFMGFGLTFLVVGYFINRRPEAR